ERRGELNAFDRTIIEIDASLIVQRRAAAFAASEGVNLPMPRVGRHGIVGQIRRARDCRRRRARKHERGKLANVLQARASTCPGCRPARWGRMRIKPTMTTARTAEASGRLHSRPPLSSGLSRKSPTVAPRGRVRMNAAQNRKTWLIRVVK